MLNQWPLGDKLFCKKNLSQAFKSNIKNNIFSLKAKFPFVLRSSEANR